MMNLPFQLILASKSPRRSSLLAAMDLSFQVRTAEVEESYPLHFSPEEVAKYLAQKKAQAVNFQAENELIIGADTIVVGPNGEILGKPKDENEAQEMLELLSGKTHQVISGVCMRASNGEVVFAEKTEVKFKVLAQEEIKYYVSHYRPYDKAGGYGIQEWIGHVGVVGIEGCYYNVMGFPCSRFYTELCSFENKFC